MKTRREFIQHGLMACGVLAAGSCRTRQSVHTSPGPDAVRRLQSTFEGQLIRPDDARYDATRKLINHNASTDKRPAIIARCAGQDDVARAIEFARQHELPLAVRSGGHSFTGWSTCDRGIVIDTRSMREIIVDPIEQTIRTGGGVLSGDVTTAAGEHGLAAVIGQCPTVGVVGLTLGGGLGWLSGRFGATCDNLVSTQIVTADGLALEASAKENPDLFWAVRGGGGNFGVVTSLTHRLHAINHVTAGELSYRMADARAVLHAFGEIMAQASDELQAIVILRNHDEPIVRIRMCWSGDRQRGEGAARQFRSIATVQDDTVKRKAFRDIDLPGSNNEFAAEKGTYLPRLTPDAIDVILEQMAKAPRRVGIGLDHYMHGAVCRVSPEVTAFELRSPGGLHVWAHATWERTTAERGIRTWIDETWSALQRFTSQRAYANYSSAEGKQATEEVYQVNYARLASIKRRFDPDNVFRQNVNVPPTP